MPTHHLAGAGIGAPARSPRRASARARRAPSIENCFLPEERLVQVALERLHLRQALEQAPLLLGVERLAVGARLDRLAQPDALLVVGDVLDLVGDRAGVDLAQARERVGERLARAPPRAAPTPGCARISSSVRLTRGGVERRVADRLASRAGRAAPPGGRACGAPSPGWWRPAPPGAAPRPPRARPPEWPRRGPARRL